jgi:hypothetical protein
MGDFRVDRRGGFGPGRGISGKPQAPGAEQPAEGRTPRTDRFDDTMTPELAARLQQRRNGQPPRAPGAEAPCRPQAEDGAERHMPRGRAMEGGPGRHGRGPDRARPEFDRAMPRLAPGQDPAQAAEALHAALDADGDGAVTREEVALYLQAKTAPAPVTEAETPETETPAAELPVTDTPVDVPAAETPAATEGTEAIETAASYYAAAQAEVVAQLEAYLQQADLPAELQVLATSALAAVMALSPTDPDFEARLNEAIAPLMAPEAVEETEPVTAEG